MIPKIHTGTKCGPSRCTPPSNHKAKEAPKPFSAGFCSPEVNRARGGRRRTCFRNNSRSDESKNTRHDVACPVNLWAQSCSLSLWFSLGMSILLTSRLVVLPLRFPSRRLLSHHQRSRERLATVSYQTKGLHFKETYAIPNEVEKFSNRE